MNGSEIPWADIVLQTRSFFSYLCFLLNFTLAEAKSMFSRNCHFLDNIDFRLEIFIFIDSGIKITLWIFVVCLNLLFFVLLYSHTLNSSIYIWMSAIKATSQYSLEHAIFVIDQSLKLFWPVCWKFLLVDHLRISVLRSFQTQNY